VEQADLDALRQAGRIAASARAAGAALIVAGARPADVCVAVEADIARLGGAPAFPAQIALNEVAAHFCPADDDPTVFRDGDVAKLDLGVHVDGWVVDTAVSVSVGGQPEGLRLIEAAETALAAALGVARPGVLVVQVSHAIEAAILSMGLKPVTNLCGHGVARWTIHCPPAVPNRPEGDATTRLDPGATVAIEVFATDGDGQVEERGPARIHRLDPQTPTDSIDPELLSALKEFHGLPFCARQIKGLPKSQVEATLAALATSGRIRSYRPLVDPQATAIAQAEHTLYVHEDRIEVLTL
jgi:methionyl aminopeptidase